MTTVKTKLRDFIEKRKETTTVVSVADMKIIAENIAQGIIAKEMEALKEDLEDDLALLFETKIYERVKRKLKGDKGDRGDKGDKGDRGEKGDTEKGEKGEKGIDADPTVVRDMVLSSMPKIKDGKDGKDGSPDKPEQIVKKLNTTEESIERKVIKGLDDTLSNFSERIARIRKGEGDGGGGTGNWVHQAFSGDDSTTEFTLSSKVAANGKAAIVRYQGQVQDDTTHYSISGKTLTMTFTPITGTTVSIAYVRT